MGNFTSEGQFRVKIIEAYLADAKFAKDDPMAIDVAIGVETLDREYNGYWTSELSQRCGEGNFAGQMQADITVGFMEKIGWKHGQDIRAETLKSLVGLEIDVVVKAHEYKGTTYYDVKYLGASGSTPSKGNNPEMEAKVKAIWKTGSTAAPFGAPAPVAEESPF